MSLDAYRHQAGGSITIAVTEADNPASFQDVGSHVGTPAAWVPVVPEAPDESGAEPRETGNLSR